MFIGVLNKNTRLTYEIRQRRIIVQNDLQGEGGKNLIGWKKFSELFRLFLYLDKSIEFHYTELTINGE